MNLWDHDKLYKNLYEQRKRKLRKRVGELGKKKKKERERVDPNFNLVL